MRGVWFESGPVDLAGPEPATSWVRSRIGPFRRKPPESLSLQDFARPLSLLEPRFRRVFLYGRVAYGLQASLIVIGKVNVIQPHRAHAVLGRVRRRDRPDGLPLRLRAERRIGLDSDRLPSAPPREYLRGPYVRVWQFSSRVVIWPDWSLGATASHSHSRSWRSPRPRRR
jgi:hypothetical protein